MLASIDLVASLTDAAIARLQAHAWPGSFRELRPVLTRALLPALLARNTLWRRLLHPFELRACEAPQTICADVIVSRSGSR